MKRKKLKINNIIHHFGLDKLEVYGNFLDESIFEKLDYDNINYGTYLDYQIIKSKVPKYNYKITFKLGKNTIFAYYKGKEKSKKQPIGTRDYIIVHGTGFKVLTYEKILGFLESNLQLFHCRRFDICIDLKIEIDSLLNGNFSTYRTGRDYRKSTYTESRYFGELKSSLNKRQVIRAYNKILDIFDKGKVDLYQEYLTHDYITRVELEIRQELAKVINYKDAFNNDILTRIFKNYLGKYTDVFEELPGDKMTLYRAKDTKLSSLEYQSIFYKTGRYNYFVGAAKTLYNLGFCPVSVLLREGLVHDKTKYSLGVDTIHDIIVKEQEAVRIAKDNKYTRQNIAEILDNEYKYGGI